MTIPAPKNPPPGEPGRSQRLSIIEGSLANIHLAVTQSALVTGFALMLGANEFHLGLITGLGAFATLGALASAVILSRRGRRRTLVLASSILSRCLWAVFCFLPFTSLPNFTKLLIFFTVLFISQWLIQMANNGWLSWMADLVPEETRGRYFGKRNTILGAISMATVFLTGRAYDLFKERGYQAQGFSLIFGLAVISAALSGLVLARQWEPSAKPQDPQPPLKIFGQALGDGNFRPLLLFFILWSLATSVAGPFFGAHMIKNLGMPYSVIALYSIIAGILNLLIQPLWGRVIDRIGNRPVLVFNMLGIFFLPLFWLLATPDFYLPIWIDAFLTGIFWPGFGLATFNLLLSTAPEKNRASYLAVQSVATGLSIFAASLLGGLLAQSLSRISFYFLGLRLINFHLLFILSAGLRLALLPLALGLREDRAGTLGTLLDIMGNKASQLFTEGLRSGVMVVKKLSRR